MARVTSEFWVSAYLRRVRLQGGFPVLRKRGAAEAGAIAIVIARGDRLSALYLPAPQSEFGEGESLDRKFASAFPEGFVEEYRVEEKLTREIRFDPDVWIVEVEDRDGRSFLEPVQD
ncbi:MAG: DUF1491 family protein [Alphaproteobacteria bacterium]